LIERNTYFYTPYRGIEFLEAWKSDRDRVTSLLGDSILEPPTVEVRATPKELLDKISVGETIETRLLLDTLYKYMIESNEEQSQVENILLIDKMVKKFEVNKRIHDAYNGGFKAADREAYKTLDLYVRAADVFELTYSFSGMLPYLNVLLKCIDTLCAVNAELNAVQKARLVWHIHREKSHIIKLANSVGIDL